MGDFASRKLIITLVASMIVALNHKLGLNLSGDEIIALSGLVSIYVAGQSHVDATTAKAQGGLSNAAPVGK